LRSLGERPGGHELGLGEQPVLDVGGLLTAPLENHLPDDGAEGVVQQDAVDVHRGEVKVGQGGGHVVVLLEGAAHRGAPGVRTTKSSRWPLEMKDSSGRSSCGGTASR